MLKLACYFITRKCRSINLVSSCISSSTKVCELCIWGHLSLPRVQLRNSLLQLRPSGITFRSRLVFPSLFLSIPPSIRLIFPAWGVAPSRMSWYLVACLTITLSFAWTGKGGCQASFLGKQLLVYHIVFIFISCMIFLETVRVWREWHSIYFNEDNTSY